MRKEKRTSTNNFFYLVTDPCTGEAIRVVDKFNLHRMEIMKNADEMYLSEKTKYRFNPVELAIDHYKDASMADIILYFNNIGHFREFDGPMMLKLPKKENIEKIINNNEI